MQAVVRPPSSTCGSSTCALFLLLFLCLWAVDVLSAGRLQRNLTHLVAPSAEPLPRAPTAVVPTRSPRSTPGPPLAVSTGAPAAAPPVATAAVASDPALRGGPSRWSVLNATAPLPQHYGSVVRPAAGDGQCRAEMLELPPLRRPLPPCPPTWRPGDGNTSAYMRSLPWSAIPRPTERCVVDWAAQEQCPLEPPALMSFNRPWDLLRFEAFPMLPPPELRVWSAVTQAQRDRYWQRAPNPAANRCGVCQGSIVQASLLFSARRWWRVTEWAVLGAEGPPRALTNASALLLEETALAADAVQPTQMVEPTTAADRTLRLDRDSITAVELCVDGDTDDASFVAVRAHGRLHMLRFAIRNAGVRCLWRTLQLLWLDLALPRTPTLLGPRRVVVTNSSAAGCAQRWRQLADRRPEGPGVFPAASETRPLPYLPCQRADTRQGLREANVRSDARFRNMWPWQCDSLFRGRGLRHCNATAVETAARAPAPVKVAVCLSGFLRSFEHTRPSLFAAYVTPHDADVFAATWNVVGRTKKTMTPAELKKVTFPVGRVEQTLWGLLRTHRAGPRDRVEVSSYAAYAKAGAVLKDNGFHNTNMYYVMQRSVLLMAAAVQAGAGPYDVVIRTRFDALPSVPLFFLPLPPAVDGRRRYAVDLGAACEMDGMRFPQGAVVEEGKLLRHYPDTRFRVHGWQLCDWVDIAPYGAMMAYGGVHDWIVGHNVYNVPQYVDLAFLLDQGLAAQPVNLFVKLLRKPGRTWG